MGNKPRIRFKGFNDDWEQCKLGDIATFSKGNGYSKSDLAPSGEPIILYGRLYTNYETTIRNVDTFVELKDKSVISQGGEVIVPASGETAEDISRASVVKNQGIIIGGDLNVIKVNHLLNPTFLALTISNGEQQKELSKRAQGKSVVHLHNSDLQEVNLTFPLLNEQKEISSLFEKMDSVITLHQCKLEKLKLTKKALLQKLFPKNGKHIPEIRFKGFTDAWEQRKLGETFEYLQNNTLSRDSLNYKNSNVKNIHYGDILVKFDELLDGSSNDIPYINSELDLSKFSKSLLRDGDIIFSDTAEDDAVGKAIELWNVNDPFILSGLHTIPCRPLIPFGKGYLGNFLNSNSYRIQLRPLVQGIKVSSISKSALKDTMIEYPKNLDEQEKIGSLFQNLAKMITLHQRKLERLQEVKKGLLQKMFV